MDILLKLVYVFQNKENTFGSFSLFTFGELGPNKNALIQIK